MALNADNGTRTPREIADDCDAEEAAYWRNSDDIDCAIKTVGTDLSEEFGMEVVRRLTKEDLVKIITASTKVLRDYGLRAVRKMKDDDEEDYSWVAGIMCTHADEPGEYVNTVRMLAPLLSGPDEAFYYIAG